jgi:hypothetical protein
MEVICKKCNRACKQSFGRKYALAWCSDAPQAVRDERADFYENLLRRKGNGKEVDKGLRKGSVQGMEAGRRIARISDIQPGTDEDTDERNAQRPLDGTVLRRLREVAGEYGISNVKGESKYVKKIIPFESREHHGDIYA